MSLTQALCRGGSGPARQPGRAVDRRRQRGERGDAGLRPQDGQPGHAGRRRQCAPACAIDRRSSASWTITCSGSCAAKAPAPPTPTSARNSTSGCSRSTASRAPARSISGVFNNFTSALQALTSSPDDFSSRSAVLSAAQVLAQQLNGMSSAIQTMRLDAENGIDDAVCRGERRHAADRQHQRQARHRQLATSRRPAWKISATRRSTGCRN